MPSSNRRSEGRRRFRASVPVKDWGIGPMIGSSIGSVIGVASATANCGQNVTPAHPIRRSGNCDSIRFALHCLENVPAASEAADFINSKKGNPNHGLQSS